MGNPLYDYFGGFTSKKQEFDQDNEKNYSQFMLNRFVSMVNGWVPYANAVNFSNIPNKAHYDFYKNMLPQAFHRVNYIKETKQSEDYEQIINNIERYYEISRRDAERCYVMLKEVDVDLLNEIMNKYKSGKAK